MKDTIQDKVATLMSVQLDKRSLSEYLSQPNNVDLLTEFIQHLHFEAEDLDFSFRFQILFCLLDKTFYLLYFYPFQLRRKLMGLVHLPEDAAAMDNLLTLFANKYYHDNLSIKWISNANSVRVLLYGMLMLHTNLHYKYVKDKLRIGEWQNSLQGGNNGEEFSQEYLLVKQNC
jgi:brefeldin A-resistance guanine nucleotide exchange factor 1